MPASRPRIGSRPPAAVVGALGIAFVALAGVTIATVGGKRPFGLDQSWHDWLASHRSGVADLVASFLNVAGGTAVMTVVTLVLVVLLLVLRRRRAALSMALTVMIASGICSLIKVAVSRPRPADGVVDVTSDSFPSGHTTTAAAITIALVIAFPRVWARVLAAAWIPLMAISRDYLLVHWLSDVIAGAVLGASVAVLVSEIARRFLKEPSPDGAAFSGPRQAAPASLTP